MKGLPQNVLLNFRLEFPKKDLTIYLPSGISEIFCQIVSTLGKRYCHDQLQFATTRRHKVCVLLTINFVSLFTPYHKQAQVNGMEICDAGLSDFLPHFWSILWPYHRPHLSQFGRKSNFRNPNLVCSFKAFQLCDPEMI